MISPAEISKASAGSIVMMSSKANATTSVSLGVAACSGMAPWVASSTAIAAAPSQARGIEGREGFIGVPFGWGRCEAVAGAATAGAAGSAVYTRPDSGINTREVDR